MTEEFDTNPTYFKIHTLVRGWSFITCGVVGGGGGEGGHFEKA